VELPESIKLWWINYKIKSVENPGGGHCNIGYIDFEGEAIEIGNDMSKDKEKVALLHELFHAIFYYTGHQTLKVDEDIVGMLAHNLYHIIKENKEVGKWLLEES